MDLHVYKVVPDNNWFSDETSTEPILILCRSNQIGFLSHLLWDVCMESIPGWFLRGTVLEGPMAEEGSNPGRRGWPWILPVGNANEPGNARGYWDSQTGGRKNTTKEKNNVTKLARYPTHILQYYILEDREWKLSVGVSERAHAFFNLKRRAQRKLLQRPVS